MKTIKTTIQHALKPLIALMNEDDSVYAIAHREICAAFNLSEDQGRDLTEAFRARIQRWLSKAARMPSRAPAKSPKLSAIPELDSLHEQARELLKRHDISAKSRERAEAARQELYLAREWQQTCESRRKASKEPNYETQ